MTLKFLQNGTVLEKYFSTIGSYFRNFVVVTVGIKKIKENKKYEDI